MANELPSTLVADEATVERNCPICGATAKSVERNIDGWDLATCDDCGFLHAPTIRANTASEQDFDPDYVPVQRARHHQIHRLLASQLSAGSTIVDVGAGFGALGRLCHERNRFSYVGFEPAQSIVEIAKRDGIDLRAELFDRESLDRPADAIVLDNVIEHVADPLDLLAVCRDSLRQGGVLVIIVPNRFDLRRFHPAWRDANHWIPPEHINYFTATSLRATLETLGMEHHPFGFRALGPTDWRYWPRAAAERVGRYPFGLNMYGVRSE